MFWCITFSRPVISDDVRDVLMQTAYLMIRGGEKRRKIKSAACEGLVTTNWQRLVFVNVSGVHFKAIVEGETGKNEIGYLFRDRDLERLESVGEGAWLTVEEILSGEIPDEKRRSNPIRKVAHNRN